MNIDEFLKNPGSEKHSLNIGLAIIRILEITSWNNAYLGKILKNQLELKELLQGKTKSEYDELVEEKFHTMETEIIEIAKKNYLEILSSVLNQDN
jgi:hypothetical protein